MALRGTEEVIMIPSSRCEEDADFNEAESRCEARYNWMIPLTRSGAIACSTAALCGILALLTGLKCVTDDGK